MSEAWRVQSNEDKVKGYLLEVCLQSAESAVISELTPRLHIVVKLILR